MRHLRPMITLLALGAIVAACASPSGTSGGETSQAPEASESAATAEGGGDGGGGGGDGGGSGANGSMTYEITGDYEASGELPFQPLVSQWDEQSEGWLASFATDDGSVFIQLNTQSAEGTLGHIWNFGDGTALVSGTSDPGGGMLCTFTLTKNDVSGTEGSIECDAAVVTMLESGANGTAHVTAQWEGHP